MAGYGHFLLPYLSVELGFYVVILPRSSGHLAKRVISKTEVNNENQKRTKHCNCPQQIYGTV
jgi:hypothetical protein